MGSFFFFKHLVGKSDSFKHRMKTSMKLLVCLFTVNLQSPGWVKSEPIKYPSYGVSTSNEEVLDLYRLGFAAGDIDSIIGVVGALHTFSFIWVPENKVFSKSTLPAFFSSFKSNVENNTDTEFFMKFDNIIQRQIGDTLYEVGDWIVEGFDRGSFIHGAREGRVVSDTATT